MRYLLLLPWYLLGRPASAQAVKPRVLKLHNGMLFEKLVTGFDAQQLMHTYRPNLKLLQVKRNRQEPAVKDSLLQVRTAADNLTLFKNRYKVLLRRATITSTKVSFAGMRVGVTQETFCRTLHLKPNYNQYVFTDGIENFVQLTFAFVAGKLQSVEYKELIDMDAID
jgi:hypothetical protein